MIVFLTCYYAIYFKIVITSRFKGTSSSSSSSNRNRQGYHGMEMAEAD